jgi:hypothetical protein
VFADAATQQFAIFFGDHDWPVSQSGRGQIAQILLAIILCLLSSLRKLRIGPE